jgi:hypothetical protein
MGGIASAPLMSYAMATQSKSTKDIKVALDSIAPFENLLSVVSEMIIPTTDTPGAQGAGVPEFIKLMLSEWYDAGERSRFLDKLSVFDESAIKSGQDSFVSAPESVRIAILKTQDDKGRQSVFSEIKELTVFGYYTSEVATKELNYRLIPGAYNACVPLEEVGKTWLQSGI